MPDPFSHRVEPGSVDATQRQLRAQLWAKWEEARLHQSWHGHQVDFAKQLLRMGFCLTPCEHLADNQILVSPDIYKAALTQVQVDHA